jgi:hypothetical protein
MLSSMIWIFATAVLYLAVVHEGFRRVVLWVGGCALAGIVLFTIVVFGHTR